MAGKEVSAEAWQEAVDLDRVIGLVRAAQPEKAKAILLRKLTTDQDKCDGQKRLA